MAINQKPIERSVAQPTLQINAGSGLNQLTEAATAVGNLVTGKLADVAAEQSAIEGGLDVERGTTPKSLAPGVTKATRAYNEAVTRTETRHMLTSAEQQIDEALLRHSDPAHFNNNSPAMLKSDLNGIKQGTISNARPEIQAALSEAIDQRSNEAIFKMHSQSVKHDSAKIETSYKNNVNTLTTERSDAALAGDTARMAQIKSEIALSVADYSIMHQGIKDNAPNDLRLLEENYLIDDVLLNYGHAVDDGNTEQFMSDLADNKQNLPAHILQKAQEKVVKIDQQRNNLKHSIRGAEQAALENGINNGTITTALPIAEAPNLTIEQKLDLGTKLDTKLASDLVSGQKVIIAKKNISDGNPTLNSGTTNDKMFKHSMIDMEESTGQVPTLADQEESILGLNQFPASGMQGVSIGTNVPAFDGTVTASLISGDPKRIAQAGLVYNNMVNVRDKTANMINLKGDALTIATLFNIYTQGMNIDEAAELASDKVLKASEPERVERAKRYKETVSHKEQGTNQSPLDAIYESLFHVAPQQHNSDRSWNFFKEVHAAQYMGSSSEQAAINATAYIMRNYRTSPYMDDGFVSNKTPETEVSIVGKGHSFGNQIFFNIQGFMDKNNALREQDPDLPLYEWADPAQEMPKDASDQDKVFKNYSLIAGDHRNKSPVMVDQMRTNRNEYTKPRIKINGVETDIVLMETPISRLGNSINYTLGAYDRFGSLHAIDDPSNTVNRVATFVPQSFKEWSPEVAFEEQDKELSARAKRDFDVAHKKELNEALVLGAFGQSPIRVWNYLKGDARKEGIAQTKELLRRELNPDQAVRKDLSTAKNIGIANPPGMVAPGNIDMNTRPQVNNKDGTVSTVRTISIEQDGLEYVIPTVSDDGKILSDSDAIKLFKKTGKHLGAFKTSDEAVEFAKRLHDSEERKLKDGK